MARRTKVIHVADKFGSRGSSVHGVSRLFTWWLPRFDTERFDARLVGLRKGDPAVETMREAGLDVIALERGKLDPRTLGDLKRVFEEVQPDIVHLHGYASANFGRLAAKKQGAKIVIHEHVVDPGMPLYQKVIDRWLAKHTDAAVAVSKSVREFMIHGRGIAADLVQVVYNGAPLDEFQLATKEEALEERGRWNLTPEHKVIGTVGRLDEQKGICYLIEAAVEIIRQVPEARFVIVGDGPYLDGLREDAAQRGVADQVVFTGYSNQVPLLQSMFDVQAFPSLWEGTPLTVFEAMSVGMPIVSTDVDGLGEVLRDGENALVVSSRDPAALAKATIRLLEDPEEAARLAEAARADSSDYDIATTVRNLERIYDEVLAG